MARGGARGTARRVPLRGRRGHRPRRAGARQLARALEAARTRALVDLARRCRSVLVPLSRASPWPHPRHPPRSPTRGRDLPALACGVFNVAGVALLVVSLLAHSGAEITGRQLLASAGAVLFGDVIAFGLAYWELDSGGPVRLGSRPGGAPRPRSAAGPGRRPAVAGRRRGWPRCQRAAPIELQVVLIPAMRMRLQVATAWSSSTGSPSRSPAMIWRPSSFWGHPQTPGHQLVAPAACGPPRSRRRRPSERWAMRSSGSVAPSSRMPRTHSTKSSARFSSTPMRWAITRVGSAA